MPHTIKKTLGEEYSRLKKVVEKILSPKSQPLPQLLLQPCRNKKNFRDADSR